MKREMRFLLACQFLWQPVFVFAYGQGACLSGNMEITFITWSLGEYPVQQRISILKRESCFKFFFLAFLVD